MSHQAVAEETACGQDIIVGFYAVICMIYCVYSLDLSSFDVGTHHTVAKHEHASKTLKLAAKLLLCADP